MIGLCLSLLASKKQFRDQINSPGSGKNDNTETVNVTFIDDDDVYQRVQNKRRDPDHVFLR